MAERDPKPLALVELGTFPLYRLNSGEQFVRAFQEFLSKTREPEISFGHLFEFSPEGAWVVRMENGEIKRFFLVHSLFPNAFFESVEQQTVVHGVDSRIVTFGNAVVPRSS
mgnify:CR=1 FL=1